ncbi:phosphohydrolase [Myxococcota bacterium]
MERFLLNRKWSQMMSDFPPDQVIHNELLPLVVDRYDQVLRFEELLRTSTSWLSTPASTTYLTEPGGLVEHSVQAARTMLVFRNSLAPELSIESCVIVSLYHDVGKVGRPGQPLYISNPYFPSNPYSTPYVVDPALLYLDVPTNSLFLLSSNIPLTYEEAQAIRYFDGQYPEQDPGFPRILSKITRLLQCAHIWSEVTAEELSDPTGIHEVTNRRR